MKADTASARWSQLDSDRQSFLGRCERYAAFTIPKICLPNGYDQNGDELMHDYQSLGAQAVNHLSNKLMLALFAPSRPFFRLDLDGNAKDEMQVAGINLEEFEARMAEVERGAVTELDRRAIRPRMYDAMKHIIVTGNSLLIFSNDGGMRVLGIKSYCVKRDVEGNVLEIVIKEMASRDSLDPKIIEELGEKLTCNHNDEVELYRWIKLDGSDYTMTQWIGNERLSVKFDGKWPKDKMPYRAITWDLASGSDYGTGLVEDFAGDFAALSIMSKATVQAAILASEFRWLVNPSGMTSPEDFENSENGAALAGVQGDITLVQSGKSADLQVNVQIAEKYVQRIGQGFMLHSAVTRHAERVTAEEIRMTAEELETSLGGAYSRIAIDVQMPMAYWLMELSGKKITGTDVKPTIVTGLAALSRAGDRDNLILFLQDIAALSNIPEPERSRLKTGAIYAAFAAARGLSSTTYLLSEDEFRAQQQAQMEAQLQAELANRMPIASPEGVDASQELLAKQAAQGAVAARGRSITT
jgi:hypothetical protein